MSDRVLSCCLALCLLLGSSLALAHYLNIARLAVHQQESEGHFLLKVDNLPENIRPDQRIDLPMGCELMSRRESPPGVLPSVEMAVFCGADAEGSMQTRWGLDGAMLEWHYLDGTVQQRMLAGSSPGVAIPLPDWSDPDQGERGLAETAWLYLALGTEHVLIGWDHLAFVFCLSLLASGLPLIGLISAFTVGHSLSLALAHFGLLSIPIDPVEAIIALSVVFMAREAWFEQQRKWRGVASDHRFNTSLKGRLLLTAGFGLIHGLGFASVLGELGVSASDTVIALLFFNLGVEVGQVSFVLFVLLLLWILRHIQWDQRMTRAALSLVGGLGIFWTLERIVSM